VLTDAGIWISDQPIRTVARRRGLLLDRDGVLVKETNYLHRPEDVALEPGAFELLAWANARTIPVCVITNQAGIARNLYNWRDYCAVESEIDRRLAERGLALDLTVACPFHPQFTEAYGTSHAYWRKPGPGMLLLAAERLALDLAESWMIGDKESDIAAAKAAGLQGSIHILSGHGLSERDAASRHACHGFRVLPASNISEAIAILDAHWTGDDD
jgi:D-glycero-D-manno-heptose 1,7-bisphosphate phosphatase